MYRKGYFRQRIDGGGWQHEYWVDSDPQRLPAALVTDDAGAPLTVSLPIYDADVVAQIWRVDVGRVPLFLLDTDIPEQRPDGALDHRAPVRRRRAHPALAVRAARRRRDPRAASARDRAVGDPPQRGPRGAGAARARLRAACAPASRWRLRSSRARERTVFTTHTPVPAGNDSYPAAEVEARDRPADGRARPARCGGASRSDARNPEDAGQPFGVTQAALRLSRAANAVSAPPRRGGARDVALAVARPAGRARCRSGTSPTACTSRPGSARRCASCSTATSAPTGWTAPADPQTWAAVDGISDQELWDARERQRAELVTFVGAAQHSPTAWPGATRASTSRPRRAASIPHVLTIGFARRVATYKRLELLMRDPDWTLSLLGGECPVQVVLAGKAHPRDEEAKRSLQGLFGLKHAADHRPARGVPRRLRPRHRRPGCRAAATSGSTCRDRRWRPAAPAG